KRRLTVRIVRAPHHVVYADNVSQPDADGVLLEAQHDVAVKKIARERSVLEAVDRLTLALAVVIVHCGEHVGHPSQLERDDGDWARRIAVEARGEDALPQRYGRLEPPRRATAGVAPRHTAGAADLALPPRGRVQRQRQAMRLRRGRERFVLRLVVAPV